MAVKGFVEAAIASVAAGCSTHPLDLIKVRMQLHGESATSAPPHHHHTPRPGPITVAAHVLRSEGPTALFSGVSATILRQTLYSATRMGLYDMLKARFSSDDARPLPLHRKVAAGAIGGGIGAAVGNPADVAMVRMQADGRLPLSDRRNYKNVLDAIIRMTKGEGPRSLWRGCSLAVSRGVILAPSQLATYDQVKEGIVGSGAMEDGLGTHVTASVAAGVAAAVASNPVDVVKTRVMTMKVGDGVRPAYNGAVDCVVKTVRGEGVMALYKGFVPTVGRHGSSSIVLFVTLEQVSKLLQDF